MTAPPELLGALAAAAVLGLLLPLPRPAGPLARAIRQMGARRPGPGGAAPSSGDGPEGPAGRLLALVRRLPLGAAVALAGALAPPRYRLAVLGRLQAAGLAEQISWPDFLRLKWAGGLAAALYLGLVWLATRQPAAAWGALGGAVAGALAPDQWVAGCARRRRQAVERELPGLITALAITLEAGLGLHQALVEAVRPRTGELARELRRALNEAELGRPQREALEALADRLPVPALAHFLSTLLQGVEKGHSGLADTLRTLAREAWGERQRRAEELAGKASLKLFIPLVALVFPAAMIFLIGPAVLTVVQFLTQRR